MTAESIGGASADTFLCRHFGPCGGCTLQDIPPTDYLVNKRDIILNALKHAGLESAQVEAVKSVSPGTRRRASLKAARIAGIVEIGFHGQRTHDIADMHECHVLTPKLFAAVQGLRTLLAGLLRENETAELQLTQADNGIDLSLDLKRFLDPQAVTLIARHTAKLWLVRVMMKGQIVVELDKPRLRIGNSEVTLPTNCFLQPTREGEAILQTHVLAALHGAKRVADLFCGVGTFALPLAVKSRVHAIDAETAMIEALQHAARNTPGLKPVTIEKRDLFRHPLEAVELNKLDAVLLDPPRAGAMAQCAEIARSKLKRVAYVSCNPVSFARDARTLADAGFRLEPVTPVDQFLWSDHIEIAAAFER